MVDIFLQSIYMNLSNTFLFKLATHEQNKKILQKIDLMK